MTTSAGSACGDLIALFASRPIRRVARATCRSLGLAGVALAAALLAACANTAPPVAAAGAAGAQNPSDSASSDDEPLPDNNLDARTLYQLLIAEIMAQRGMPDAAFIGEFNLARETRDPRIARRATEFALQAHEAAAALEAAELWKQLSPNSEEANGTVLTILVLAGHDAQAEPMLREVLDRAPVKGVALLRIASTLARSPDHAQALAVMQKIAADFPDLPEAHLAIAQTAASGNDTQTELAQARAAARLEPDNANTAILTAQYLQAGAPSEAEHVLVTYLKRDAKSAEVREAYARFLIGQKRYDDATTQFQAILRAHPQDADIYYALGLLAYQAERPRDAEKYFNQFVSARGGEDASAADADDDAADDQSDANPAPRTVASAYLYLAQIAEERKDYPLALAELDHIDGGEDYLNARMRRAMVLAKQGKLEEARTELHDLQVRSEREHVQVLLTEAQLLRDANRGQEALDLIGAELAKHPDDPDLLYDQGMTAEKLDRLELMESSLRTLIQLHPENAQAYNALGYTFADRNIRLEEARQLIEKALSLAPEDASIIDSLGWVQYRLGNNEQALTQLERAYSLRNDPEIAVHLGEVLWVSGRRAEAEKYWKEAGHKEPDNEVLRATLARFNVRIGAL